MLSVLDLVHLTPLLDQALQVRPQAKSIEELEDGAVRAVKRTHYPRVVCARRLANNVEFAVRRWARKVWI